MDIQTVYSIGYGNKTMEEFLSELHSYGVRFLVDIRSKPYSKFNQHFSQQPLKMIIEREHIKYVYMGQELGGLPVHDSSCFTHDGKVDYDKLKEKDFFKRGLQRLINANSQGIKVCIMCSESDPKICHRSKLIGVELQKIAGIELQHIVGVSKLLTQTQVISGLTKGLGLVNLFGEENLTSRKAYLAE
ncbi:MAG: DUF488 domain-containing protein [Dysgonamonadaceae bacterium]|jgi:uncharacterized protein (DUF488 family)|nr:DUF488 domain-containing protein [Dysgonamonadaceae bacterium]